MDVPDRFQRGAAKPGLYAKPEILTFEVDPRFATAPGERLRMEEIGWCGIRSLFSIRDFFAKFGCRNVSGA